jgi:hypothetical protein
MFKFFNRVPSFGLSKKEKSREEIKSYLNKYSEPLRKFSEDNMKKSIFSSRMIKELNYNKLINNANTLFETTDFFEEKPTIISKRAAGTRNLDDIRWSVADDSGNQKVYAIRNGELYEGESDNKITDEDKEQIIDKINEERKNFNEIKTNSILEVPNLLHYLFITRQRDEFYTLNNDLLGEIDENNIINLKKQYEEYGNALFNVLVKIYNIIYKKYIVNHPDLKSFNSIFNSFMGGKNKTRKQKKLKKNKNAKKVKKSKKQKTIKMNK